jgi:hypothetical protein
MHFGPQKCFLSFNLHEKYLLPEIIDPMQYRSMKIAELNNMMLGQTGSEELRIKKLK